MKQSDFPEWALDYKKQHHVTLKQRNDNIYVYRKTSKRDPVKKNPVTSEKYLGTLTKDHGLIPPGKKLINVSSLTWNEYGWSRVMLSICPERWKKNAGVDAELLLHSCIISDSTNSYLKDKYKNGFDQSITERMKAQKRMLYVRINELLRVDMRKLEILKNIIRIKDASGNSFLSYIDEEMQTVLDDLKIDLQVVNADGNETE